MYQQDKVWSRYGNDKVDVAATLGRVVRTLAHALPTTAKMRALSIGSSNEPQFRTRSTLVDFWCDDFERLLSVVWMILLHPNVHDYSPAQRIEITTHVYEKLWRRHRSMVQMQDDVVIYRGRGVRGLV